MVRFLAKTLHARVFVCALTDGEDHGFYFPVDVTYERVVLYNQFAIIYHKFEVALLCKSNSHVVCT